MVITIISMSSITYANKAKFCLSLHGIKANIVNTPKGLNNQRGCGYSLSVKEEDEERAISLLKQAGFKLLDNYK